MASAVIGRVLAIAFVLLASAGALADDGSARAEQLFRAGRQASARGDHEAACESYRESFRIENAVGTLLNIAVCEEALGQLALAFEHYERVLPALGPADPRHALTRERLRALERRLPRVRIVLMEGDAATTRIVLGEREHLVADLNGPLPIDPGAHELRVVAEGREPRSYPFEIDEAQQRTLAVSPGPPLAPPEVKIASAPPQAQSAHVARSGSERAHIARYGGASVQRTVAWALIIAGGVSLVGSAAVFGVVLDRKNTVDDHCSAGRCDEVGLRAARSGRTLSTVSLVSLAAGAALSATGFSLLWTSPEHASSPRAELVIDQSSAIARLSGSFP